MVEINNMQVFGIDASLTASGYPMLADISTKSIAANDIARAKKLGSVPSGTGHDCFLKGIVVWFDIKYPQYFSAQLQRYHFLDIVSSQSKMHMIQSMEIKQNCNKYVHPDVIAIAEDFKKRYNDARIGDEKRYHLWMCLISNLPMGFEMTMKVVTNYLQLKTIYKQRNNHKLKEDWGAFIENIEALPYFLEFIGKQ